MLYATSTMRCFWHAAYFDAEFIGNYGSGMETMYRNDVVARAHVVMQLDSIFRDLRQKGKLPPFKRWILLDHYYVSYDYVDGKRLPCKIRIQHDTVYMCMIDSVSLNQAMRQLWNIPDVIVSPHKESGMWLYSLHIKTTKSRWHARNYPDTLDEYPRDRDMLWLFCENAYGYSHCFYQHETDGFFHQYTGLYLTTANVLQAQELIREHYGINTSITSQYVTPAILRKYVWY
ncbi:MAG TPA: hypothetical protein ENI34_00705 [candidate division WOR-3 bacterium]|uniref:Uncharacterized protein n=1 Tax=candidate division WOR-3 bacterium TaxID=2052148 RepID=A0A9C9EKL9_UNCW3|nr:hypothetical protein [candidate division WOR-3 bacterium]